MGKVVLQKHGEQAVRNTLRCRFLHLVEYRLRKYNFIASQRPQLQGIGENIVKAQYPGSLCVGCKGRNLQLPDLLFPCGREAGGQGFNVLHIRLANQIRVLPCKFNDAFHMAAQPAIALFIHQLRKLSGQGAKIHLALFPGFRGFFCFFRDTAPCLQGVSGVLDILIGVFSIPVQIPSGDDGQDASQTLKIQKCSEGEPPQPGSIPLAGGFVAGLLGICVEFFDFVIHARTTSASFSF